MKASLLSKPTRDDIPLLRDGERKKMKINTSLYIIYKTHPPLNTDSEVKADIKLK